MFFRSNIDFVKSGIAFNKAIEVINSLFCNIRHSMTVENYCLTLKSSDYLLIPDIYLVTQDTGRQAVIILRYKLTGSNNRYCN